MKKGLKLGIVALSLVAMASTIYTANVHAQTNNEVKVEIVGGSNNCSGSDYDWGQVSASITDTELAEKTGLLYCSLLESTGSNIQLQLTDLEGETTHATIASGNFTVSFGSITKTGSLNDYTTNTDGAFNETRTAYHKDANKVGEMSRIVTLSGTINAGQQVDKYEGTLHITIME